MLQQCFVKKTILSFNSSLNSSKSFILKWTDTKTVHFLYDNDRKFNRKDVIALRKPTYYLWRNDFSSQEEFEAERRKYVGIGFRVVTFQDRNPDTDIHEGIKALVKNHWDDIM